MNDGICVPFQSGGFSCKCSWGFTGLRCETSVTDCASNPCTPNKICKAKFGGGFDCVVNNLFHENFKTLYDQNVIYIFFMLFKCPANRAGVNCEIHNDLCERNPCLNGGVCSAVAGGSFICECSKPWSGTNCENSKK